MLIYRKEQVVCTMCAGEVIPWNEDTQEAHCPECCPDHDFQYDSDRRWHHCVICDEPVDQDWYDYEP